MADIKIRTRPYVIHNYDQGASLSTAFNPLSLISGMGGFWRADAGVTQSGGNVTQWNDQSGFGNNLTVLPLLGQMSNPQISPIFSSTGFTSNRPGILFGNHGADTQSGLGIAFTFTQGTAASFFILFQDDVFSGNTLRVLNLLANGFTGTAGSFSLRSNAGITWEENNAAFTIAGPTNVTGAVHLLSGVFDGTNMTLYNGATQFSQTADANIPGDPAVGTTLWCIGQAAVSTANFTAAFFGLTQRMLTTTDLAALKNWSNLNWGTSV
jgi:hypothetical protein